MTHKDAEDRKMRGSTTIDHVEPAQLIGIIASGIVAAILVVAFVIANLGLGFEGRGERGQLSAPPAITSN
jgi:hypothetical protein